MLSKSFVFIIINETFLFLIPGVERSKIFIVCFSKCRISALNMDLNEDGEIRRVIYFLCWLFELR